MSSINKHSFVLGPDAIGDLSAILGEISNENYCAAGSECEQFKPEFHLPIQLLFYAHNFYYSRPNPEQFDPPFVSKIINEYRSRRNATEHGDVSYDLIYPYPPIRIVHDSDHGIVCNPNLYGEKFIPTQLVLEHATRLADLTTQDNVSHDSSKQQSACNRNNVIVVTKSYATIDAALAGNFQVWNYYNKLNINIAGYRQLLMDLNLVAIDYSSGQPAPKAYPGTTT